MLILCRYYGSSSCCAPAAGSSRLEALDLSYCAVGDGGLQGLVEAALARPGLTHLHLCGNAISQEGAGGWCCVYLV